MDEIEKRLRDASESCIKTYEAWRKDQKNADVREALQEAVHELRKVGSRLEIEMAVSERDQMADRPLAIPPHRSSRRRGGPEGAEDMGSDDDSAGNQQGNGPTHQGQSSQQGQGNRPGFNRGHNNGPRGRRPMQGGGGGRPPQGE